MSKYRIKMNGKTYEMEIELVDEKEGTKSSRERAIPNISNKQITDSVVRVTGSEGKRPIISNDNKVFSLMPGAIIRIMAQVGDSVAAGDPILILEAMKMENEICAQKGGKIKKIFVTEGQTVPGNAPLFEMEE